jgi:GAF domain-containing protein
MAQAEDLQKSFTAILEGLLRATDASRTTLRLDLAEAGFHVDDPAAEARQPDINALTGVTSLDQRALDTVRWMEKHRELLVQEKCEGADPAPPQALIEVYGVKAQMLGPIVRDGEMIGWISVHENRHTRRWSEQEIAALRGAVDQVHRALDGTAR